LLAVIYGKNTRLPLKLLVFPFFLARRRNN
jgi:hypothetical protein